jgi:hypothetical protein
MQNILKYTALLTIYSDFVVANAKITIIDGITADHVIKWFEIVTPSLEAQVYELFKKVYIPNHPPIASNNFQNSPFIKRTQIM